MLLGAFFFYLELCVQDTILEFKDKVAAYRNKRFFVMKWIFKKFLEFKKRIGTTKTNMFWNSQGRNGEVLRGGRRYIHNMKVEINTWP